MYYPISIERTVECHTAVVQADTTLQEFPALWRPMLDKVWAFLGTRPGLQSGGHNVMLYRHKVPGVEVSVEVGVQVNGAFEAAGGVIPSTLPASQVATTVHTGAPANLGEAHVAVRAWTAARGHELTGVSWEIYGDPDPETGHFDVAVYWQIA